jgi:flagellar biosynthetic protein FliQ
MTPDVALHLLAQCLFAGLLIASPVLGISLLVGLAISIFQVVTQIQEMSLTFIPKLIAVVATLVLLGAWMLQHLTAYARGLFASIPGLF